MRVELILNLRGRHFGRISIFAPINSYASIPREHYFDVNVLDLGIYCMMIAP